MSIKAALKTKIEAVTEASTAGLVVYYGHAPQRVSYPYGVLNRIGPSNYDVTQAGRLNYNREVFQLDLYDDNDDDLETVRNAIIAALNGQGLVTWSSVTVHVCRVLDARDLSELEADGTEVGIARHEIEIAVKYDQA